MDLVKLYYRIGEVSQIVGVQPHVLRYWESEFHSIRPQKSRKGQRVYSRLDVEKLLRVKDLLRNQGFTIAGAKRRLHGSAREASGPAATALASLEGAGATSASVPALARGLSQRSPGGAVWSSVSGSPEGRLGTSASGVPLARPEGFTHRFGVHELDRRSESALATFPRFSGTEAGRCESAPAAKSLRRRLVEIRRDVVRMLTELPAR